MNSNLNLFFGYLGEHFGNRDISEAIRDIKSYYICKISLKLLIIKNKEKIRSSLGINIKILI